MNRSGRPVSMRPVRLLAAFACGLLTLAAAAGGPSGGAGDPASNAAGTSIGLPAVQDEPHRGATLEHDSSGQVLEPYLTSLLSEAGPEVRLRVFVHADAVADAVRAAQAAGMTVGHRFERVDVVTAEGDADAIRRVAQDPTVSYVEADRQLELQTDTSHVATRGAYLVEEVTDAQGRLLDGRGVSVAVVDTGVDGTHPAFLTADGSSKVVRNVKMCPWYYPTGGACAVEVPGNDSDTPSAGGHGTHVAGTVGGVPDVAAGGEEVRGAAPGATIIAVSAGAAVFVQDAAQGFEWVLEHHADPCAGMADPPEACPPIRVVNASFTPGGGSYDPDALVVRLTDALIEEGVTVVFAAGNGGGDGGDAQVNRYSRNPTPGVLSVANYSDRERGSHEGTIHPSSSRGETGRPETYPDLSAPGTYTLQACRYTLPVCRSHGDLRYPSYGIISGTSMAAPHVAGIVAQLLQLDPSLTPAQVEHLLEDTAHRFSFGAPYEADPRNEASPTSFDKGHGLVDAAAAAARITGDVPPPRPELCPADDALVTDPSGDVTWGLLRVPLDASALDVVAARIGTTDEGIRFSIEVDELPATGPTQGQTYDFRFSHRDTNWEVSMHRRRTGEERFRLVDADRRLFIAELDGRFDPATDTVNATVPPGLLDAGDGDQLTEPTIVSWHSVWVPSPSEHGGPPSYSPTFAGGTADEASTSCAFTYHVG